MKKIYLLSFLLFMMAMVNAQIVTKWNTNAKNDGSKQIIIPTVGAYTYMYVKADDASVTGSGNAASGNTSITFPSVGEYIVTITPSADNTFKFNFFSISGSPKLSEIQQWGIQTWNPDLTNMFNGCSNLKITATDVPDFSNVTNMSNIFANCSAITTIPNANSWYTSKVTNMNQMFYGATAFNQNIGSWDTANVTNMSNMFYGAAAFNQDISGWNTANVNDMSKMFLNATSFNQDISGWNTTKVLNMSFMFYGAAVFNQDISGWNTAIVKNMSYMFYGATAFNQNIGNWNTAKVSAMNYMFYGAAVFNQDISGWNTAKVTNMNYMFYGATAFNQNIGNWSLNSNVILNEMLNSSGLSCVNYGKTLKGWAKNTGTPTKRNLGATDVRYGVLGKTYRTILTKSVTDGGKGWTISGDTYDGNCEAIITKWNTNANYDDSKDITIPAVGNYTYTYTKADNASVKGSGSGATGNTTISFPSAGEYIVNITPSDANTFKFIFYNVFIPQSRKLSELQQWGSQTWYPNLSSMFSDCINLKITATDVPDFSNVTNMSEMFSECYSITTIPNANNWDTSKVTDMNGMFMGATTFNQNISSWDTSKVTDMENMFNQAKAFNQDISNWNTSNVNSMRNMFYQATVFNQNIGSWDTSKVTNMNGMFYQANAFNQNIGSWDTSKVTNMAGMFEEATAFNQNLGNWKLSSNVSLGFMFSNSGLSCDNYGKTLKGWAENTGTPTGRNLGADNVKYGAIGKTYRDMLTKFIDDGGKGWIIAADIYDENCGGTLAATDISKKDIVLYPNPVKDVLHFSEEVANIRITDLAGRPVKVIAATTKTADVTNLAKGVYIITTTTKEGKTITKKIVKE